MRDYPQNEDRAGAEAWRRLIRPTVKEKHMADTKKKYMLRAQGVKRAFDEKNILNPGKVCF